MISKPITFIAIAANMDHIYGLSADGEVYFREKPAHNYGTGFGAYAGQQKKEDNEDKKVWKKLFMEYRVDVPKGGQEREAQAANEPEQPAVEVIVEMPARKIYKDVETVKSVQTALKMRGFYKKEPNDTYKIDGDLGNLTVTAIKAFQKSVNLIETGEIDLTLWNALGLGEHTENETVIEITSDDLVEDDDEVFVSA